MDQPVLAARVRKSKGKGAARRLRKNNQIPAIFYGPKTEPIMLAVDYPELKRVLKKASRENILLELQIQSEQGTETRKVMLKEILIDPVRDACLHADFHEIAMDKKLTVNIPIRLINTPEGVTQGGILQQIRRELMISCLPDKLVDVIELDVSGLGIGDSLHIRDIGLPEGIRSVEDDHLTVAVVAVPTVKAEVEEAAEVEGEEGAEGEKAATETEEAQ